MPKTLLPLLILSVLTAPALAQMNHNTSSTAQTGMTTDLSALRQLGGRAFDRAFLSMMIPHHQAAVAK